LPVRIGSGAAEDGHIDGARLVEQVLPIVDTHQAHDILGSAIVYPPAAVTRIDEGPETHMGQCAGLVRRDVPEQVGDDALGQVIGLDAVFDGQRLKLRHQPPMTADYTSHQALVAQVIESPLLAVSLPGRIHQGQAPGGTRSNETLSQPDAKALGEANADESAGGDRIAIANETHRVLDGNHLALARHLGFVRSLYMWLPCWC
jgi:hypothetical protein